MTILLKDIRPAVDTYLDTEVSTTVSPVQEDTPSTMNPGEFGTFLVIVQNADAPDGVRLITVRYHLTIEPEGRAVFEVPATPPARASSNANDPVLAPGSLVSAMFLFPVDDVLEVGDTDSVVNLRVKALQLGTVTINSHVHAKPDEKFLFPSLAGSNGSTDFDVV